MAALISPLVSGIVLMPPVSPRLRHNSVQMVDFPEISSLLDTVRPYLTLPDTTTLLNELRTPMLGDIPPELIDRDWVGPVFGSWLMVRLGVVDWRGSSRKTPVSPTTLGRYDSEASRKYFAARPGKVLARLSESAAPTLRFGMLLLLDYVRGEEALKVRKVVLT